MKKEVLARSPRAFGLLASFLVVLVMSSILATPTSVLASRPPSPPSLLFTISVPWYSQYQGQPTRSFDCGPTSVVMVLHVFNKAPKGSIAQQIVSVRKAATGSIRLVDTNFADLERALRQYNLPYIEFTRAQSPQPQAQMQRIIGAMMAGFPVIALIDAQDFGRTYDGHWIVITGFDFNRNVFYINDPDNQSPKKSGWIKGGAIQLPYSIVSKAVSDAPARSYGITVLP